MRPYVRALACSLLLLLASCGTEPAGDGAARIPDGPATIYVAKQVVTMDPERPRGEAVAVVSLVPFICLPVILMFVAEARGQELEAIAEPAGHQGTADTPPGR